MKTVDFMSLKEVAIFLGQSESWMRANFKRLGIPYYRIGANYRFKEVEVDAWIEDQRSGNVSVSMGRKFSNSNRISLTG